MNKLLIVELFSTQLKPLWKTDKILGGAGTYTLVYLFFFNLQSAIVSVVGDDFHKNI
jgi:hypothetical protein